MHFKRGFNRRILGKMKPDYIFICFDSCRYDTFKEADAPNMKAVGRLRRAHSFSCFTPASILGYMMNFSPIGLDMGRLYPYRKWAWLPTEMKKDGYSTAFLTANAAIPMMDLSLGGILSKTFDLHEVLKYEGQTSVEAIVEDSVDFLEMNEPVFLFLLLMETHAPMFDGRKAKIPYPIQRPSSVSAFQKRAVEFIDEKLEPLFSSLREREPPSDVIITSDHGELLGPMKWCHNPSDLTILKRSMIEYSEALFEIPFIKGRIT
ncbi:MAG: sulfatase-like hydrolase/transferase [Candidatus Bathyarchaeota archaeon]|nr:MAG: sulfatase-like hydrolase/transferase [Candidatus Bathyarchaeota archaeon]